MTAGRVRRRLWPLLVLVVVAAGGCSDAAQQSTPPAAPDPEQAVRDECLSTLPVEAQIRPRALEGATDGTLQALEFPSTGTRATLVLLPQVGGGVCGWSTFAHGAAQVGFSSIVVAPCGYGESTCSEEGDADPLNEVTPALVAAREDFDSERVVLMGASMGGSLTVLASAAGADADTWIDVSGPSSWEDTDLLALAPELPAGGLVVMARSDGAAAYTAARSLARGSGARFLGGGSGHGYELLVNLNGRISRIGRAVLAHAGG